MDDTAFMVEENRLLHKRPGAIREAQIRKLEFKALFEECRDADNSLIEPAWGTDSFRYSPRKD